MKVIKSSFKEIKNMDPLSIALGTFDGVHRGHQKIIKQAVTSAKEHNLKSAVLTFDKHPLTILKPESNVKIITDNDAKAQIIESLGVDYLFFINFDYEFSNTEDIEFLKLLKTNFNAEVIVCGYNYTFGNYGKGNPLLLNYYKDILNYQLKVVERITFNNQKISSTIIREKINSGKISEANALLGYKFFCIGKVIQGKALANKLGFPTANIKIDERLCVKNGVYISMAKVNGKMYPSISNIGYTPTVESKCRTIETHIINFNDNLYGKVLKIELLDFIREETKFNSVLDLKNTVLGDIESAKKYFSNNNIYNE